MKLSNINLLLAAIMAGGLPASAMATAPDFFSAAICEPTYSASGATELYEAAEKLGNADTSVLGAAIYPLPRPIERDGFKAVSVVFASTSVGVLLEGHVAQEAAGRYSLARETSRLLGASRLGFSRGLPDGKQAMSELGTVSIVARESAGIEGKTLLACEFVSHQDRQALERYDAANGQ